MRALVTGVAGFVGSTLAQTLVTDGWNVRGVDAYTNYYDPQLKHANLRPLLDRIEFTSGDLNSINLAELLEGVDVVFHQAGQPGVRMSWGSNFAAYANNNVLATQRLLEAALKMNEPPKIVYASSSSVYGDAETYPTLETALPAPRSPYGVTKLTAEHLVSLYAKNFGLPAVSLRYFTVYGPKQRPDMAFTKFMTAIANDQSVIVYGDGEAIRDFTFVGDICQANIAAAIRDNPLGAVYNISGGASVSVNNVLELLTSISGREVRVRYDSPVPGDVTRTGGASDLAIEWLGWRPSVSLLDGLGMQWEWILSTRKSR